MNSMSPTVSLAAKAAVVIAVLAVSLVLWGPAMEYPTTVSQVESSGGGDVVLTLDKSVRQVTAAAIDGFVDWLTVKGSWLFDGLSDFVTHVLVFISRSLLWIPVAGPGPVVGPVRLRRRPLAASGLHPWCASIHWLHGPVESDD